MAAHKLVRMIDPARAKLVFELLHRDVVNVALAQVAERCAHYAELDPSTIPVPAKGKKAKRYGITITAPNGKEFETVRVTAQLLATAFSETYRSLRGPMQCNSQNDFLFYLQGTSIVDTEGMRFTLAVDGNRFVLKMNSLALRDALQKKIDVLKPAPEFPKIVRNDVGDLTPATRRAFRDLWNSLLDDAKEPLASISENCMLKTPRYLANVTRVEIWFGHGRDKQHFNLAYIAKGATDGFEPRTLGKHFPLTAQGIAAAMHALRVRCPMPSGNVAAKPPKAEAAPKKADAKKQAPKKVEVKPLPKPEAKKQAKPAPKSVAKPKADAKKPAPKQAPKKGEAKPVPAPFTADRDTTGGAADAAPKTEA